jgi:hypothetical protein
VGQQLFDEVVLAADSIKVPSTVKCSFEIRPRRSAASIKSFKPRDGDPPPDDGDPGNPPVDFHGEKRSNGTHQSTTDPQARLFRKGKGKEARLVFMAHALMENRNGMLTDFQVTEATGTAEREVAPVLVDQVRERRFHPKTLGGDKNYDTRDCVADLREFGVTPHVCNGRFLSHSNGRKLSHPGWLECRLTSLF